MRRLPNTRASRLLRATAGHRLGARYYFERTASPYRGSRRSGAAAVNDVDPTEVVRSRGYGPSTDLLKGVPPTAPLEVQTTTLLHPCDADIQQRVLALSRPSPAHVTVLTAPETASSLSYRTLSYTPPLQLPRGDSRATADPNNINSTTAGSLLPSASLAAVRTQLCVMEEALQERLTTAANLIVAQVAEQTGRQLHTLEMAQSAEGTTLAQMIMNCVQDELRTRVHEDNAVLAQQGQKSNMHDDDAAAAAAEAVASRTTKAVETTVSRVVERVVVEMEKAVHAAEERGSGVAQQLEHKLHTYFTQLQADIMRALDTQAKTPAADDKYTASQDGDEVSQGGALASMQLSDKFRQELVETIEQATRAQHDRLSAMLETMLENRTAEIASSSGDRSATNAEYTALHDMIEGSLQHATDNIRLSIAAEMKKLTKASAKAGGGAPKPQDEILPEALAQNLSDSIEEAIVASHATLKRVRETDVAVKDMHKEQTRLYELTSQLREMLLQQQQQSTQTTMSAPSSSSPAATSSLTNDSEATNHQAGAAAIAESVVVRHTEDVLSIVREVKDSVERLSRVVEASEDNKKQDLLTTAQVVSDSVSAAIEARTQESVESAMRGVQDHLGELVKQSMSQLSQTRVQPSAANATEAATASKTVAPHRGASSSAADLSGTNKGELEDGECDDSPGGSSHAALDSKSNPTMTRELIMGAVKEILTPPLQRILAQLDHAREESRQDSENNMLTMAKTLSEAVHAAMSESAHAANSNSSSNDTVSALQDCLTRMQAELIESVQSEMGKTHEVDLTPMYRYIDGMMAFVKEELVQQGNLLTTHQQQTHQHLNEQLAAATERLTAVTQASHAEDQKALDSRLAAQWTSAIDQLNAAQATSLTAATQSMAQQLKETLPPSLTDSVQRAWHAHSDTQQSAVVQAVREEAGQASELTVQCVKTELQLWRSAQEHIDAEQRSWLEATVRKAVDEMTRTLVCQQQQAQQQISDKIASDTRANESKKQTQESDALSTRAMPFNSHSSTGIDSAGEQAYRDVMERIASERHQEVLDMIQNCVASTPEVLLEHLRVLRSAMLDDKHASDQLVLDKVEALMAAHEKRVMELSAPAAATVPVDGTTPDEEANRSSSSASDGGGGGSATSLGSGKASADKDDAAMHRESLIDELKRIHVALSEHGGMLNALRQHAGQDTHRRTAAELTDQRQSQTPTHDAEEVKQLQTAVDGVRAEMQTAMESVHAVLRQLGGVRGEALQALLQRLRVHVADVQLLHIKSTELQKQAMHTLRSREPTPNTEESVAADTAQKDTEAAVSRPDAVTAVADDTLAASALASFPSADPEALRGALDTMKTEMLHSLQQLAQQVSGVEQQQEVVHDNIIDTITRVVGEMTQSMERQRLAEQQASEAEAAKAAAAAQAAALAVEAAPRPASVQDIHEALDAREAAMHTEWQKVQRKTAEILRDVTAETVSIRASHAAMQRAMQERMDATAATQRAHWEHTLQQDATRRQRELDETLQNTVFTPLRTTMQQLHQETERAQQTALDTVVSHAMTHVATQAASAVSETMRGAMREERQAVTAAVASAQAVSESTKQWLTTEAASLQRALATPPQPPPPAAESKLPLWWLLLNPLLTFLSMLLCSYVLFAAFLLAFVPLPLDCATRAPPGASATSADAPMVGDSQTAETQEQEAQEQQQRQQPLHPNVREQQNRQPSPAQQQLYQPRQRPMSTMPPSKRVVDSFA